MESEGIILYRKQIQRRAHRSFEGKLNHAGSDAFSSAIWGFEHSGHHFIKKEARRSLANIGIDDEKGIELKQNLKRKSQINRLVGQIVDYLDMYSYVIIVLCGRSEQEAVDTLKHNLKRIVGSNSLPLRQEKCKKNFKNGFKIQKSSGCKS